MKILILILLVSSCGKQDKKCVSGEEKRYQCLAEETGKNYPAPLQEWQGQQCARLYPTNFGCY